MKFSCNLQSDCIACGKGGWERAARRYPPTLPDSQLLLLLQPSVKLSCSCSQYSSSCSLRPASSAASRPASRSQRSTTVSSAMVLLLLPLPLLTSESSALSSAALPGARPEPNSGCCCTEACMHAADHRAHMPKLSLDKEPHSTLCSALV
jgi:hypothetical protein